MQIAEGNLLYLAVMRRLPYLIFIAIFLVQWLLLFSAEHPEWDGVFYYAYARSIVMDGDLQLANDIELAYQVTSDRFARNAFHTVKTQTGFVDSPFAIGTAIIWVPWLLLARLFTNADGYEPFVLSVQAALPAFAGLCAYFFSFQIARQIISRKSALISVATLMCATPLIYYQFIEPFYSHTMSALLTTICVGYWWRKQEDSPTFNIGLGMLIGCAALVRWQNGMYLLLIGIPAAIETVKNFRTLPNAARKVLLAVGGFLAVMTIQFTMWRIFYGSWITVPQGDSYVDWTAPRLWPTLFSTYRGLLFWMPIFFPAVVGLVILCRRHLSVGLPLLCIVLFEIYVNGSTFDWFGGGGFGPRRFTSELAILVIGYAVFLDAIRLRWQFATLIGTLFALHHWILLRFGLEQQIGGYIVVFNPEYIWAEDGVSLYFDKLLGNLPLLWRDPNTFWVAINSPVYRFTNALFPSWQLFGFAVAGLFCILLYWGGWRWSDRYPVRNILLGCILVGISVMWLLLFA